MGPKERDEKVEASLQKVGLEPITPQEARSVDEDEVVRVDVEGASSDDLGQLLEDTANFLRNSGEIGKAAAPYEGKEVMFRRVNLQDFIVVAHRS
ncbi:MAG: hypothetical protein WDZ46_03905 [Solirubrobacterales bacterium]